jgi:steroid delta-isomerase-like uncharacterized protein
MSEADNRRLIEEAYAALNRRDLDAHLKLLDDSYVWESDTFPAPVKGREAIRQTFNEYWAAFPDMRVDIEQIISSGDHVVVRYRTTGTQKGEFKGIAPTNRQISINGCNVHEVKNGLCLRTFGYFDRLAMREQLGVVPTMAKAAAR